VLAGRERLGEAAECAGRLTPAGYDCLGEQFATPARGREG
jgi:hypothetical protein